MDTFDLCGEAIRAAKATEFERANRLLSEAAASCGLLVIPLEGYGEAGRAAVANAARIVKAAMEDDPVRMALSATL